MKRFLMALVVVGAVAGLAVAQTQWPEGFYFDPDDGMLEGHSWGFPLSYGPGYYNALVGVQARILTLGEVPPQVFDDDHDAIVKGGGNPGPVGWDNFGLYGDVAVLTGGNDLRGGYQYFTAWFELGTVSHYVVTGSPDFVFQMQAYGYDVNDPNKEVVLLHNQEFFFEDGAWHNYYYGGMAHARDSGYYGYGVWGATSLVPEPVTALGVLMGVSGLAGYIRKRRTT